MRSLMLALLLVVGLVDVGASAPLTVTKQGGHLYIRGSFDSTHDIIQRMALSTGQAFSNDTVNFSGAKAVLKASVGDDVAAFTSGSLLAPQADDVAPLKYNGTYIGANHGALIVVEATAVGHGKIVTDVGSDWTDADGTRFTLMRVVDADKLWLVSEDQSTGAPWSFKTAVAGPILTPAGPSKATPIIITGMTLTQLWPALQGQVKAVLLDGRTPIEADGVYSAESLDIVNTYSVPNPVAVVDYVRSKLGGATQPSFVDASIKSDITRTITYRFAANVSCVVYDSFEAQNDLWMDYVGTVQAGPLAYAGKQLWQYIPQTQPIMGSLKTWDFARGEDISGRVELLHITRQSWADADIPPNRMMQVVKHHGFPEFGMMLGYSQGSAKATGGSPRRSDLVARAGFISPARKQYPIALEARGPNFSGKVAAGESFHIVAFRSFWSSGVAPDSTAFTWYQDGADTIVVADFHKAVSMSRLPLPPSFIGKKVSVVSKSDSLTVEGGGVVTADGLAVSVTGEGGAAVLRLR